MEKLKLKAYKRRRRQVMSDQWAFLSSLWAMCEIISLVWFDTQRITKRFDEKGKPRVFENTAARRLMAWQHGASRQRLIWKARLLGIIVPVYSEDYTTRCCGLCYRHNDVGGSRLYICACGYSGDRDGHGAWNQCRAQVAWGGLTVRDRDRA